MFMGIEMEHWTKIGYKNHYIYKFQVSCSRDIIMLAAKTLISPSRKFNAISLITTVYYVTINVANKLLIRNHAFLDHFIFLTGTFGS